MCLIKKNNHNLCSLFSVCLQITTCRLVTPSKSRQRMASVSFPQLSKTTYPSLDIFSLPYSSFLSSTLSPSASLCLLLSLFLITVSGSFCAMDFHHLLWFVNLFRGHKDLELIPEISYLCLECKRSQLTQNRLFIDLEVEKKLENSKDTVRIHFG